MNRFTLAATAGLFVLLAPVSKAHANGRFPESNQLFFSANDHDLVLLRVTFGLLVSHDRGKTFDWVCEASVGYSGIEDPMYAVTPTKRFIGTTFQGVTASDDQACSWKLNDNPALREVFVDLAQNPNDGSDVIAFSSSYSTADDAGNSIFESQLWETKDEGQTFAKLGSPLQQRLLGYTIDLTKTDANRIYVSAVRDRGKTGAALLLMSKDRGQTWTEQQVPLLGTESSIWIAGVDPVDADNVYLRTSNNPDAPGRLILREKDPQDAGAGTFRTLFTGKAPLDGFALSPDNKKIWVGSPLDGVWMASTTDFKFEKKSETAVKCLAAADDGLWACSNEAAAPIGFIAGVSTDDGATFTPKAHFCSIRGPLSCATDSTTAKQCNWTRQSQVLGCDSTADQDGGGSADASGLHDANTGAAPAKGGGCDCQAVLPSDGWTTVGGAAGSIVAALFALVGRRRRRR